MESLVLSSTKNVIQSLNIIFISEESFFLCKSFWQGPWRMEWRKKKVSCSLYGKRLLGTRVEGFSYWYIQKDEHAYLNSCNIVKYEKNGLPSLMPSIALVSNYWNSLLFYPALSSHPFVQFCRICVTFIEKDGEEKVINVPIGMSMLEAALEHDIDIEGNTWAWYSMFSSSPESPFFGLLLILLFI